MERSLESQVRERADEHCEYCRLPQAFHAIRFEIEHIISRQHRGRTILNNLAVACTRCNRNKGPNLTGIDPESDRIVRLFHPRNDFWNDHFAWDGPMLRGKTEVGRTTIEVLKINHPDSVRLRASMMSEGFHPPPDPPV